MFFTIVTMSFSYPSSSIAISDDMDPKDNNANTSTGNCKKEFSAFEIVVQINVDK